MITHAYESDLKRRYKGEIDSFVAHSVKMSNRDVIITHNINQAIIDVKASKAYAESGCLIMSRFPHDGHDYRFNGWCHLVSRLEKVDGTWKVLTMEVIYLRDIIVPVHPAPDPDYSVIKDWPRKSYKFATWHLMMRGLEVRKDLPGWENEQSVKKVRHRNLTWLKMA